MYNIVMGVLVLVAFVAFICVVGFIYTRSEKIREERSMMEKKDPDLDPNSALTKMAMHAKYNGLSTRGRVN